MIFVALFKTYIFMNFQNYLIKISMKNIRIELRVTCTMEVLPTPGAPTKTTLMWLSFSFPNPLPLCD